MKSVTQAFKDWINKPGLIRSRSVYYKRRYWSQASIAYVWEADWTLIPESQVSRVDPVTAKLDLEGLNEFKVSNLNLVLRNDSNEWLDRNKDGKFGPNSTVPTGYEPYWTKFKIHYGFELSDGTPETVCLFTGLATDFIPDVKTGIMSVRIEGLEAQLVKANAENVSTRIVEENMGTGNGSTADFTTVQPGVGIIEYVSVAGTTKKPGTDYSVSQLNEKSLGAKITFETAAIPTAGQVVRITYRYWKQNRKVEDFVADLLTEAGIAGANQIIDPVVFSSIINNIFTQTTQTDWLAGTVSDIDLYKNAGDVSLDYNTTTQLTLLSNFASSAGWWMTCGGSPVSNYYEFTGGYLRGVLDANAIKLQSRNCGTWTMKYKFEEVTNSPEIGFFFLCSNFFKYGGGGSNPDRYPNSYEVRINKTTVQLNFWDNAQWLVGPGSWAVLGSAALTGDTSEHTVRVSRTPYGRMRVYVDDVLMIDATHLSQSPYVPQYPYLIVRFQGTAWSRVDDLYYPNATLTGYYVTQYLDTLVTTPISWGKLKATHVVPLPSTIAYYTRVSADHVTWDDWVAVADNWQVMSALKRYLQVKAVFTKLSSNDNEPTISELAIDYKNNQTLVSMGNFTGMTVYQAIQAFGKFSIYEFGFNSDETFFFRNRRADANVDIELAHGKNATEIVPQGNGYDKIYNEVQATYDAYVAIVKDDGLSPDSPSARFLKKRMTVDGGNILLPTDTDVASGIASMFYVYYSKPRKRFKATTKMLPHADLSDTVSLTWTDVNPERPWLVGNQDVAIGDDLKLWGGGQEIADRILCKVVGVKHDTENEKTEFDLEEII